MDDPLRYFGADWTGFALTLASLYMLGNHRRSGFLLGAASSVAWLVFSVLAGSTATVIANCVFFGMNLRGWAKWRALPEAEGAETNDAGDASRV